ncbi:YncE family protein [Ottowia thiooxydans]|uniref:YncE family protein n=1 Tax=Ottowia thiooxydans TaxID=219182 RepID=UPI000411B189|nr:YncE family protein [Ottowia thiooxydans]
MTKPSIAMIKPIAAVSLALALAACASPSFEAPDANFKGRVNLIETPVVMPGSSVKVGGQDFKPGQEVTIYYGGSALNRAPAVVGADGKFRAEFKVPQGAETGNHSLTVNAVKPAAAVVLPLKVSPNLPLAGQERFDIKAQKLVPGLYQAAYSTKNDRVFVTSAVGRPPVSQTELVKINPQTLAIEARVQAGLVPPPAAPAAGNAGAGVSRFAVYGVAVDDVNGTVWVTNTRQDTVAVYSQADLKLIKQFDAGVVPHARDVIVDSVLGKAYATPVGQAEMVVFDTKTLAVIKKIPLQTTVKGPGDRKFSPMSLELDAANHRLFTVSMSTNEAAIINTRTDQVEKVIALEGARLASGVAYDAKTNRLLVASQGSDNLLIVDAASGKVLHDVKVGAGPLNVSFEPVRSLAYVSNRASDTVTVVDLNGKIVANLAGGSFPNHTTADGKGGIFSVNKARGTDDPQGDRISYIKLR